MKKILKRVVSLAMAGIVSATCFAGCGKKAESGKTTLTWYVPCSVPKDEKLIEERVNELIKDKIDAKLNLVFVDNSAYQQKINMIISAGDAFDMCFTSSWMLNYADTATKGGFMEISSLLDKYGKDLKKVVPKKVWNAAKINGELYAVPNYQVMVSQHVVCTYKSLADKYNFDMTKIKDIKDIEPYLEIIKQNEPSYIPFRLNYGPLSFTETKYESIASGIYIPKDSKDYKVTDGEDKRLECARTFMDWYDKGYIRADINTVLNDSNEAKAGRYAFFTRNDAKPTMDIENSRQYGAEVVSAVLTEPYMAYNAPQSAMTAISNTSKHPELAMQLLNIVNTDKEVYNTLCYGIEGKHYKKLDDGTIEYIDGSSNYKPGSDWIFGCQFNAYVMKGQPLDVWELTEKYNESAKPSPLSGFYFDKTKVETEIANVSTVSSEYNALFNGSTKKADFDRIYKEYIQKRQSAGYDKIMKEMQRQINEWVKNGKK